MSAIDYLRQLQASMPYSGGVSEGILKQRTQQIKNYADLLSMLQPSLENHEKWFRENLILPFLSCIPRDEARTLYEIPVGLLPIYEPNAWALRTPSDDHLIVLHTEMLAVLSFYNEVQGAMRQIYQKHGMDVATSFIRDCFRIIFETCANELFIVAHEFAHVALGHTGKVCVASLRAMGGSATVRKIAWEQQQELDADLKALEWLHQLHKNSSSIFIRFAALSPIICAEVLMLIHFIEAHVGFPDSESSHPPALMRMENIFSQAQEMLSESDKRHLAGMIQRADATRTLEI